jgi:hypothetical protein
VFIKPSSPQRAAGTCSHTVRPFTLDARAIHPFDAFDRCLQRIEIDRQEALALERHDSFFDLDRCDPLELTADFDRRDRPVEHPLAAP